MNITDGERGADMRSWTERIAKDAGVQPMCVKITYLWEGDSTEEESRAWTVSIVIRRKAARVHKQGWCDGYGATIGEAARDAITYRDEMRAKGAIE